jgi:homospermidine synthase
MHNGIVITVLGSAGGVARAVLTLLNRAAQDPNDPIYSIIAHCQLHLVDRQHKREPYYSMMLGALRNRPVVHQFNLTNLSRFRDHLRTTKTTLVIDVSWGDTVELLRCCNGLGVRYINTALENRLVDENVERYKGFPLIERLRTFEQSKPDFTQTTAVVCSGMNPGVVQWMALELMKKEPGKTPLGCYIVEHDSTFLAKPSAAAEDTIYSSWSPECFLDEALLCYPMLMSNRTPLFLYEPVYAVEFKVQLGAKRFFGCLMPHEEVFSLCTLFNMEGGFLYRVNEHTTALIRTHLDQADDLWDYDMVVLDPTDAPLDGEDLVGVLLVYDDKERYIYNVCGNKAIVGRYGVNATYFQVACGVYGALATLLLDSIPVGIYYVDELLLKTDSKYGTYVSYYLRDFVEGVNPGTDGLLCQRMRRADG